LSALGADKGLEIMAGNVESSAHMSKWAKAALPASGAKAGPRQNRAAGQGSIEPYVHVSLSSGTGGRISLANGIEFARHVDSVECRGSFLSHGGRRPGSNEMIANEKTLMEHQRARETNALRRQGLLKRLWRLDQRVGEYRPAEPASSHENRSTHGAVRDVN
jgi:hypothetical protein